MKNEITGITFLRPGHRMAQHGYVVESNQIVLHLREDIPGLGYSPKEISKLLKKFAKLTGTSFKLSV